MIHHELHEEPRDEGPVERGIDSDDPLRPVVGSEIYGRSAPPPRGLPPGDGDIQAVIEVLFIEAIVDPPQIEAEPPVGEVQWHVASGASPDPVRVELDVCVEVPVAFPRRPPDELRQRTHHLGGSLEEHVMDTHPDETGHGGAHVHHGSHVVRDGKGNRLAGEALQPLPEPVIRHLRPPDRLIQTVGSGSSVPKTCCSLSPKKVAQHLD